MSNYQAKQFIGSPNAEMTGEVYLGMAHNLRAEESQAILKNYGITHIVAGKWYPHQIALDVGKTIHQGPNGTEILVAMGRGIGQTAVFPNEVNSFDALLAVIPHIYQTNIRNAHPEEYFRIEPIAKNEYVFINNTPSSNQLIYGMLWEWMVQFRNKGADFRIMPHSGMEQDAIDGAIFGIKIARK